MTDCLQTNNEVIRAFYLKNPAVDFESVNLWLVNLFESVLQETLKNESLKQVPVNQVLNEISNGYIKKGEQGEIKLDLLLNKLDTTAQIINGKSKKICGDFQIFRTNKPTVFLESKASSSNISHESVERFVEHSKECGYSGIFMSQNSGIAGKSNYQIDLCNGNVLVYIHSVDYDLEKIKTGLDIIDKLSIKLQDFNVGTEKNTITKEILDEINKEYQLFVTQKESIMRFIKENQKELLNQIEDIKFVNLDKYLSTKFTSVQPAGTHKCNMCNFYTAKSLKGLAAHKRGCKKKYVPVPP
jgi:hypothetical protein